MRIEPFPEAGPAEDGASDFIHRSPSRCRSVPRGACYGLPPSASCIQERCSLVNIESDPARLWLHHPCLTDDLMDIATKTRGIPPVTRSNRVFLGGAIL
jgi:hypothetical protein